MPDATQTPIAEVLQPTNEPATSVFNPMYATATAYADSITMTAQAFTATPTIDPQLLTAYANTRAANAAERATRDACYAAGQCPTPTNDPLYDTATAIILTYLPKRISPTPLTEQDLNALREQWKTELETAVGFTHPVFDEVVDGLVGSASFARPDYVRGYHIHVEIERLTYGGNHYIAVIAQERFDEFISRFMLFQMIDGEPVLLPDPIQTWPVGYQMSFGGWILSDYLGGFADRNGNGYPDLAIDTGTGGSSPTLVLILLEFRPGGEVVDITPQTTDVRPRELVDVNGDGVLEIRAFADYLDIPLGFPNCCDPVMMRYYAWDGTAYRAISTTLDESQWPFIQEFWESKAQGYEMVAGCHEHDLRSIYQVLIDYLAMGRLNEGWMRVQPLLHLETSCPPQTVAEYAPYFAELEAWVKEQLGAGH